MVCPSSPHATLKVGDPVSIVPRSVPSEAIPLSPPAKYIALPIGLKPIRSEERIFAPAGVVEKYTTICQPAIRLCVQLSAVGMHARSGCRHGWASRTMPRPTALQHMHTKSAFGHIVDVGRQGDHPILCVALDRQPIQQRGLAVRVHHLPMRHRRLRNLSPTVFMNAAAPFANSPLQQPSCIRWITRDDGVEDQCGRTRLG